MRKEVESDPVLENHHGEDIKDTYHHTELEDEYPLNRKMMPQACLLTYLLSICIALLAWSCEGQENGNNLLRSMYHG